MLNKAITMSQEQRDAGWTDSKYALFKIKFNGERFVCPTCSGKLISPMAGHEEGCETVAVINVGE